jgi:hypothetical protein
LGHLEYLWRVGYSSGEPVIGDELDVEIAAKWCGERGAFVRALCDERVRLLDKTTDGLYAIHDLHDHAPRYVQERWRKEQSRKEKERRPQRRTRGGHVAERGGHVADKMATPTPAPAPAPIKSTRGSPERIRVRDTGPFRALAKRLAASVPVPDGQGDVLAMLAGLVTEGHVPEAHVAGALEDIAGRALDSPLAYFWRCVKTRAGPLDVNALMRRVRLPDRRRIDVDPILASLADDLAKALEPQPA